MTELVDNIFAGDFIALTFRNEKFNFPRCFVEKYLAGNINFTDSYCYDYPAIYAKKLLMLFIGKIFDYDLEFLEFIDKYVKLNDEHASVLMNSRPDLAKKVKFVFDETFQETFMRLFPNEHEFNRYFSWNSKDNDKFCRPRDSIFDKVIRKVLIEPYDYVLCTVQNELLANDPEACMLNYILYKTL